LEGLAVAPHKPATSDEFKILLDHVRGHFQYHAGQRLTAIRYFFVAYAVFIAGYLGTFSTSANPPGYARLVISGMALVVTLAFWILDRRNAEMVEIDERAAFEIENLVAVEFLLDNFRITNDWEDPKRRIIRCPSAQRIVRYGFVMPILFFIFTALSAISFVLDLIKLCH
jgi:hypothetical protein